MEALILDTEKPVRLGIGLCERCQEAQGTLTGAQQVQRCRVLPMKQPVGCPKTQPVYTMSIRDLARSLVEDCQKEVDNGG